MGLNLNGVVVCSSHEKWESSEWNGRKRDAGEAFVLYIVNDFRSKPIRVRVSPEAFSEWTSARQGERVSCPVEQSKDRFYDFILKGTIETVPVESVSL